MTYLDKTEVFLNKYISDKDKQKAITDMFEILRECMDDNVKTFKEIIF